MKPKSIVLFDMDGVILDSANAIVESLRYALQGIGYETLGNSELHKFVGPPLHSMISELIPNESPEVQKLFETQYRQHNNEHGPELTPIFDGVSEMLEELSASCELVIATSKLESAAVSILDKKGLTPLFSGIFGTSSNSKDSKTDVISRAITNKDRDLILAMIGDRVHDIDGAKDHALRSVAVTWGYAQPRELQLAKPDHIVESPTELTQLLQSLN
jgi:phosphoglycolate phosphatase